MFGPTPTPVAGDTARPDKVDVVIIGAGIVGASAALELTEMGMSVALCEKGIVAGEQSSRNLGWIRITGRAAAELPLAVESARIWSTLESRIGRWVGYNRCGIVWGGHSDTDRLRVERMQADLAKLNLEGQVLDSTGLAEKFPGSKIAADLAVFSEFDARAEPQLAAPAIAEGARDRGAIILTNCAVTAIHVDRGQITSVDTDFGKIQCKFVVVAAGAWSSYICRLLGITFPQLDAIATAFRIDPVENAPNVSFGCADFLFRAHPDRSFTLGNYKVRSDFVPKTIRFGPSFLSSARDADYHLKIGARFFEELMGSFNYPSFLRSRLHKHPIWDTSAWADQTPVLQQIAAQFPVFKRAKITNAWGGYLDVTPDTIPVISAIDRFSGLFLASGFSGHGFGMGPGAGRLIADLVTGAKPLVNERPFALSRIARR
jgi:glycine/D-amino acid oxidase-like deaminating enzyme